MVGPGNGFTAITEMQARRAALDAPVNVLAPGVDITKLPDDQTVVVGRDVTFTIEVFNQGAVEASDIALIDYIPSGLTLDDGNWTPNAAGTRATLNTPIASIDPSSSARVNISFTVDSDASGQLDNHAEIQIDDGDDADSLTELEEGNNELDALVNDEINDDGTLDEDDHDDENNNFLKQI